MLQNIHTLTRTDNYHIKTCCGCCSGVQFPASHCFVITINISQGQTFKALEVTDKSFRHGMLNVALSRYDDECVELPFLVEIGCFKLEKHLHSN